MATIAETDLDQLRASLSHSASVVTPSSKNYEECIKRWSDSAAKRAAIIVYPTSAKDAAAAVLFSQAHSLDLAVVGGGHSTGGNSSSEGGLCIDLAKMRDVSVDPVKMTITAQGGALWSDVDITAGEYGLATVGGTVNHTGIGGLTLGGGYGWLSGQYGLAIDNLLEAEVVLADGSIVKASETENPDLFWALRGAGPCFGVVTSFVYKAHEQKAPVFAGLLAFPPPLLSKVIDFANHQVQDTSPGGKQGMLVAFGCPPPAHQPCVLAVLFYNGTEEEGKKFFAPLFELGPVLNQVGLMPYPSVNGMLNSIAPHGGRKVMKGSAFMYPLDPAFAQQTFDDYSALVQRIPETAASAVLFEYWTAHQILKVPPTKTAFANRGAYCGIAFMTVWVNEANDTFCRGWSRDMAAKYAAELDKQKKINSADKTTMDAVGQYANYDGLGNSTKAMFGTNLERLVIVKKQYDPKNVFRKWANLLA